MNFSDAWRHPIHAVLFRVWEFGMDYDLLRVISYSAFANLYFAKGWK